MGGIGSGRHRYGWPRTCESYSRVDLAWLRRRGMLVPGVSRTLSWAWLGHSGGSTQITARASGVQLGHEFARFTFTPSPFNGRRQWFACPGCEKPCRVLYGIGSFRCRRCHSLSYNSQHSSRLVRALDSEDKLRRQIGERLGREFEGEDDFPAKPKRMRWRTYTRLRSRYFGADAFGALLAGDRG